MLTRRQIRMLVHRHGREIIAQENMIIERRCYQHGAVTTFAHSIRVACLAVWMADRLRLWRRVDLRSLIRAALLHDYFLYDWHDWDNGEHRLHGFTHGRAALENAMRDFGDLNHVERDSIARHMFPLTPLPPRYIEGYLVTMADKVSATRETLSPDRSANSRRRWGAALRSVGLLCRPRRPGTVAVEGAYACRRTPVPVVPVLLVPGVGL